jgi:hypothetical protein
VPDAAAQQKAMRTIEEVYRRELGEAKTALRQAALAEAMLKTAVATRNDPAGQYALMTKAQDLATTAGRFGLALDAAAEIARRWDVDELKLRSDALTGSVKALRGTTQASEFSRAADDVVKDAVAAGRLDLARRTAEAALAVARAAPGSGPALAKEAVAQVKDVADLQEAYIRAEPALAQLKNHADDAPTRLAAGKYLCFARGDWAAGLPHLAAGDDPTVSPLAKEELGPTRGGPAPEPQTTPA